MTGCNLAAVDIHPQPCLTSLILMLYCRQCGDHGPPPQRNRNLAAQRCLTNTAAHLAGELVLDVQFIGGATMAPRAHECLENARNCDSLAIQAKDPLVKAALQEAARQWRERAKRLEQQIYCRERPAKVDSSI
jgi:hypothetical protein